MHVFRRLLVWPGLILACAALHAEDGVVDPEPFFVKPVENRFVASTLLWENDSVVGTDKEYTNGTRIELTLGAALDREAMFPPLTPFLPLFKDRDEIYGTLFIGQDLYSPQDISVEELQVDDRPYAGWLYGGIRLGTLTEWDRNKLFLPSIKRAADYTSVEVSLGVVGPWALGYETQSFVHDLIHVQDPMGWDYQVPNEVVVDAGYFRSLSLRIIGNEDRPFSFDIDPFYNLRAGTVHVHGGAGVAAVLGLNHKLGATPRRNSYSAPLSRTRSDQPWEVALFASAEGRGVAWNTFLDGPVFADDSHSVDKNSFIWHSEFGVMLRYRFLVASYIHVLRSEEFAGQDGNHIYGSGRIGLEFPF